MAYQAGRQRSQPRPVPESLEAQAYLQDYATLLEAVPFPSFVFDDRWDVVLSNVRTQRDNFNALPNAQCYRKIRFEEVFHHYWSRHAKEVLFWKSCYLGRKIERGIIGQLNHDWNVRNPGLTQCEYSMKTVVQNDSASGSYYVYRRSAVSNE